VPQDEFAVTRLVAVEVKAWLVRDQGLEQRLALDERQPRHVLAIKVQEIETIRDEPHATLAVGRVCAKLGNPASSRPQSSPSM
jgi:hypothetical protein